MKKSVRFLLALVLIGALASSAQAAVMEPPPQVQAPSALTKPSTPACKPPCLTPQQEAALVEVRKILHEARQVAEGIEIPNSLITSPTRIKGLEIHKNLLRSSIEDAQLRAGNLTITQTAASVDFARKLAFWQTKYGYTKEAVQTASQFWSGSDEFLVLVDALTKAGDIPAALAVAETNVAKIGVDAMRYRNQAGALSLIALRQHERGDLEARKTLSRAQQAAQAVKYPPDRYLALLYVARAQAMMGDRAAGAETFRQAIRTALAIREKGGNTGALRRIGKAQAETGDHMAGTQTFQQVIRLSEPLVPLFRANVLGCLAWTQAVSGDRAAAAQTFQQALRFAESLPVSEKGRVLRAIGDWQVKAGERDAVAETLRRMLRSAESNVSRNEKLVALESVAQLAIAAGDFKVAIDITPAIADKGAQARVLAMLANQLVVTKDPFGTPEIMQQLSQIGMALMSEPFLKEQSAADSMLSNIAIVQTAANDIRTAQRLSDQISFQDAQISSYGRIVSFLIKKGDLAGAKHVAAMMKEERFPWNGSVEAIQAIARAYTKNGESKDALAWARQQENAYARARALLGVAEGIMEQKGIENIQRKVRDMPMQDNCPTS